ncbi:MAG: hypothetical protein P0Y59_10830 [Candidatus Sphingomonas phytovorans]|nr:hypothetical protein [Sphingomonas sp.]WEK02141.1 MAG: hypothetical protein P0Y59_10830 [Sphingomonas sp.]
MTLFNPFGDHDAATRRLPDGGAVQRSPFFAAPSRRIAPFGPRTKDCHAAVCARATSVFGQPMSGITSGRSLILTFFTSGALIVTSVPAYAQRATDHAADAAQALEKREILVTGHRPDACDPAAARAAIDYACLNGALKTAATTAQPTPPTVDATIAQATTPSKVGTFSHAATAQRMGQNFGHSAQPYRPPSAQYANPVRGTGPR